MPNPQDDPALIHKIAAMTDAEFAAVVDKARGATNLTDVKDLILRELTKPSEP